MVKRKIEPLKVILVAVAIFYIILIATVAIKSSKNRFEDYDIVPGFLMVQETDYTT